MELHLKTGHIGGAYWNKAQAVGKVGRKYMRLPRLNKLQWRLTISYTLASVAASVFILLVGGLLAASAVILSPFWPRVVASDVLSLTPQIRPVLEESPPAGARIASWLLQLKAGLEDPQHQRVTGFSFSFDRENTQILLLVADVQGRVLASAPENAFAPGASLTGFLSPEEQPLLSSALQGITNEERVSQRTADGSALAIVPILDTEAKVLGVMMARIRRPFTASAFLENSLRNLPVQIALVAPCAAIFGVLFGFLIARRLARRIDHLGSAALEWGHGNFGSAADDPTRDELGQLAHQLNRMAGELRELLALRQEMAALDERHRLARELHDTVKQQVFAASMQISAARGLLETNPQSAALRLDDAEKLMSYAQHELKAALRELRPTVEQEPELAARLKAYVGDWGWQSNITATFTGGDVLPLPQPTGHALFRIAQEALASLANVARHSGAAKASVELSGEPGGVVALRISDDGRGFAPSETSGGMGLRNMRERAEALPQGRLTITSKSGQGTRIEITCATGRVAARKDEENVR